MEGEPKGMCLVDVCDRRMRRDGLCSQHLRALVRNPSDPDLVRAVKAYHARHVVQQAPAVKRGTEGAAASARRRTQQASDNDRVRRAADVLASLGVVAVRGKGLPDGEVLIQSANGLRVILDDDDIEQFMALAAIADPVLFGDGQIASAKDQQRVDRLLRGEATK